jgi:hypothetical protein
MPQLRTFSVTKSLSLLLSGGVITLESFSSFHCLLPGFRLLNADGDIPSSNVGKNTLSSLELDYRAALKIEKGTSMRGRAFAVYRRGCTS